MCPRRSHHVVHVDDLPFVDFEVDAWEVVNMPVHTHDARVRFVRVVRRVVMLLRLRYMWSQLMSFLNTPAARRNQLQRHRITQLVTYLNTFLRRAHNARQLFGHLTRRKGKLVYTNGRIENNHRTNSSR